MVVFFFIVILGYIVGGQSQIIIKTIASIWGEKKLRYLSLDIICSSKLTVFLALRSSKTVRVSEHIMYADKYPSIFSPNGGYYLYIGQRAS